LAQRSLGLAAIEVNHRGIDKGNAQRKRVGEPLGQRQSTGDACERLFVISEQPFDLSADDSGADTGCKFARNSDPLRGGFRVQ
jgi:hypothetical protein